MNYTSKRYLVVHITAFSLLAMAHNVYAYFNFQEVFQNNNETKQIALFIGTTILNFLYFGTLGASILKLIEMNKNKDKN